LLTNYALAIFSVVSGERDLFHGGHCLLAAGGGLAGPEIIPLRQACRGDATGGQQRNCYAQTRGAGADRPIEPAGFGEHGSAATGGGARSGRYPYRLSNTTKTVGQLTRMDHAILLANALIDTDQRVSLPIPRTSARPATPVASWYRRATGGQRVSARLREAGAAIVSYIPNNAYLVRVSAGGAERLAAHAKTQTVLAYEPYYKLASGLLKLAVEQKPLPSNNDLNLTLSPTRARRRCTL